MELENVVGKETVGVKEKPGVYMSGTSSIEVQKPYAGIKLLEKNVYAGPTGKLYCM